jgi:CubicO group peptidase (beta-lactamase class C family)
VTTLEGNELCAEGWVAPGFEPVRNQLNAYLLSDPRYSAQVAAYSDGELVVDLVGGPHLDRQSITGVFSVTKGVASLVVALLVERGELDLDELVTKYWPEFAAHGKGQVTVRQLLSHQGGLPVMAGGIRRDELTDSSLAARRLADTFPQWRPGSTFGYHGLTIGFLIEELVRRATGQTLHAIYENELRSPWKVDFYVGLPQEQESRFRPVLPVEPTPEQQAEIARNPQSPDGLLQSAFLLDPPQSPDDIAPNDRAIRMAGPTAIGGIGSAAGLAKIYAAAITDVQRPRFLSEQTVAAVSQEQVSGEDRVLGNEMAFAIGFAKPTKRIGFGSYRAFGHDGAGGALAFADPMYGLGYGYVPLPMQYPGGADAKSVELSALIRKCIREHPQGVEN